MRSRFRLGLVLLVPAFFSGIGCASHPLSRTAQEGSTIAIPLGTPQVPGTIGFGGTWYQSNGIFDDQRGRLTFTFSLPDESWSSAPVDPLIVTRAFPDPSTVAAQTGTVFLQQWVESPLVGQIIALVTIPDVPSQYENQIFDIDVGRKIRTGIGLWETVTPVPSYSGQIEILPGNVNGVSGASNPPETDTGTSVLGAMDDLFPRPTAVLDLPSNPDPAAGRIVVSFPDTKAEFKDVVGPYKMGEDSIVTGTATGPVLEIHFVAPYETLSSIGVVFMPIDPFGAGIPILGDFVVDENASELYDVGGNRVHNATNPTGIDPEKISVSEIR